MTEHTPGPWHVVADPGGFMTSVHADTPNGRCVAAIPWFDKQALADTTLIAAAPDLLSAAKALLFVVGREAVTADAVTNIRAAIAQAEGTA